MNKKIALVAAFALAFVSFGRAETPAAPAVTPVSVEFVSPENFTDVKDSHMGSDRERDALLAQIKEYVTEVAVKRLGPGQSLTILFKDIDMAGDYEPWRTNAMDVRIVKDIYPPRVKLSFKLMDASGAVLREGDRNLADLNFMSRLTINRSDELKYEKVLLSDWVYSEFPKVKKS